MEVSCEDARTSLCYHCDYRFKHSVFNTDPITSALRSNYYPTPAETEDVQRALALVEWNLKNMELEISRIRSIFDALLAHKMELERFQRHCASAMAPIRKLPPELLRLIFMSCFDNKPDVIPVAGQVCRHWRDICVETPELWSQVSVGRTRFGDHEKYRALAALFLERSGTRPLGVTIREPVATGLLDVLVEQAQRWGSLKLAATHSTFYSSLSLDENEFPNLEQLEIVALSPLMQTNLGGPPKKFTLPGAPNLRRVVLKDALAHWELPWRQLTHFQYDTPSVQDGLDVLEKCSGLLSCSLDRLLTLPLEDSRSDPPPPRPLRLRHLTKLRLAIDTSGVVSNAQSIIRPFLTRIHAPRNLTSLELIGQYFPDDLIDFLARNDCRLEHLVLGTGYLKDESIIQVLEALPLLRSLELDADIGTTRRIQNRVITDKLLTRLIVYPESDTVLPSLERFTLRTALNFDDQVLLDIIASRWEMWAVEVYGVPVAQIGEINLHFCGRREHLQPDTIEQLREYREDGLQITLRQGIDWVNLESSS